MNKVNDKQEIHLNVYDYNHYHIKFLIVFDID